MTDGGADHVSPLLEARPMQQQDVEISRVHRALQNIARAPKPKGYVVICSGTTHANVTKDAGAEVLYSASGVNGAWNYVPLPKPKFFIARLDQARIPEFFTSIDDYACVAFMIVPADEEQNIIENIILDRNPFRSLALKLPDHLLYFVDTDNPESSTGISEAISVGSDSPLKGGLIFA